MEEYKLPVKETKPPVPKLSETLSSGALFTFTTKMDYLISMLEDGIRPRYIFERIPVPNKTWYYTVAAKCFCDIPLGKIKSHLNWFGNYGLGINMQFLKEKGVSPIIYIHSRSHWIIDNLKKGGLSELCNYPTLPFLKRYKGDDYKREDDGSYIRKNRKFYDEREWRYVSKNNNLETGDNFKLIKDGLEHIRRINISTPYTDSSIIISPNIVEYIIISSPNEFKELKKRLRGIYPNDDDYELMLSKILIANRIIRDF
jgi:hypothetical protein